MLGYAIRRLVGLVPVFFAVSALVFLIIHLLPGDPIDNLVRAGASSAARAEIAARYGLDRPLWEQYVAWLGRALSGDLGTAIVARRPVAELIGHALPYSLTLGAAALAVSAFTGLVLGALAAALRDRWPDRVIMGGVLLGSTLPGFWLGLVLILVFAVWLGWFPVSGARGWESLVLPVATVALGGTALVTRVARTAMVEAMRQDFVLLLHATGMHPLRVLVGPVLRAALVPVLTILSLRLGWILGGAVTVEVVFARPGLGTLLIRSLNQQDYPVVQACLLMLAIAVMLGTLLGDLLLAAVDPRLRAALRA